MKSASDLIKRGDYLFSKRQSLLSYWQEVGDNFYPERAQFTSVHNPGDEFAAHLMTSYPLLARRDLGSSIQAIMRPTDTEWMRVSVSREDRLDNEGHRWLEWATGIQRRAMYDRAAKFVRATKEGDNDFVTFGQAVLTTEEAPNRSQLLYRCWHLRDVAWAEGVTGDINEVHRKWKPTIAQLMEQFKGKLSEKVVQCYEKEPYKEIECRHILMPFDDYGMERKGKKSPRFVSIYLDAENEHVMEETGISSNMYTIPRWQTVSGSQYAYSPASVAALPDARLIQAVTRVLLEAGEKFVDPPMIATQEAIRSDVQLFAGGLTWVDSEYNEKMGEVLRPLTQDKSGIPLGFEISDRVREMIAEAFYLNKLNLPPAGRADMTAYEVGQRVQEYIRQTMPLFEPLESEYNGSICENTFDVLMRGGAFGDMRNLPDSLRGQDIQFKFDSPLHDALDRAKASRFNEASVLLREAMQIDPSVAVDVDVREAFRDAMEGLGVPAKWMVPEEQAAQIRQAMMERQQAQELAQEMEQGAGIAKQMGEAGQALEGVQ